MHLSNEQNVKLTSYVKVTQSARRRANVKADSLQRPVVLGHVCERSLGADQVLVHAGFLHPHHPVGIFLLLLLLLFRLLAAGVAGLLTTLLHLLLLGFFGPVGKRVRCLV